MSIGASSHDTLLWLAQTFLPKNWGDLTEFGDDPEAIGVLITMKLRGVTVDPNGYYDGDGKPANPDSDDDDDDDKGDEWAE